MGYYRNTCRRCGHSHCNECRWEDLGHRTLDRRQDPSQGYGFEGPYGGGGGGGRGAVSDIGQSWAGFNTAVQSSGQQSIPGWDPTQGVWLGDIEKRV